MMWAIFTLGLMIGVCFGVFVTALLIAAKDDQYGIDEE